jgi:hypothetical protein
MTSYSQLAQHDPALAAWRDAEIARAGVELAALKVEAEHAQAVIADLRRQIKALEAKVPAEERKRKR